MLAAFLPLVFQGSDLGTICICSIFLRLETFPGVYKISLVILCWPHLFFLKFFWWVFFFAFLVSSVKPFKGNLHLEEPPVPNRLLPSVWLEEPPTTVTPLPPGMIWGARGQRRSDHSQRSTTLEGGILFYHKNV